MDVGAPEPGDVVRGALCAVRRVVAVQGILFGVPRAEPWVVAYAVWYGPRWGWRRAGEATIRAWRAWRHAHDGCGREHGMVSRARRQGGQVEEGGARSTDGRARSGRRRRVG